MARAESDRERVERWFAGGELLHPAGGPPTTVDLARALARIGGLPLDPGDRAAGELAERIGGGKPLLFVLVDGLGDVFLDHLCDDARHGSGPSLFAEAERVALRSVFPSTTAAALAAIATGEWPSRHAVPAWFTHLHRRGVTATILPFVDRASERGLRRFGIGPGEAFPCPSRLAEMPGPLRTYHPAAISNSEFTAWGRGRWPTDSYEHLRDAVAGVGRRLIDEAEGGVHYLYLPMLDSASHRSGPGHPDALGALHAIDGALGRLREQLEGRARIAVSADHGALAVGEADKHMILRDDPLLDDLHLPPHGEPRVPMFCTRPGAGEAFAGKFRERWGGRWALLSRREAEELELFGPGRISPEAAERIGDYIAVGPGRDVLLYGERGGGQSSLRGYHAGLRPEEMEIPLLLA